MARKLTKKQKGFVKDYLETGNGSLAAKNNYNVSTDESARAVASQNLTKPTVMAYLELKAEKAAEFVYSLAESAENEGVRLGASKDILDRAGYKPVEKSMTLQVQMKSEPSERIKQLAEKLRELDVWRKVPKWLLNNAKKLVLGV